MSLLAIYVIMSLLDVASFRSEAPGKQGLVFLGGEDPLEKGVATLSSILAWRIPWAEEPFVPRAGCLPGPS